MTTSMSAKIAVPIDIPASADVQSAVIQDCDELQALIPQWRRLQQSCVVGGRPFDPTRIVATLRVMGGSSATHALVRSAGGDVVTMVIGRRDRRRIKCRVGYLTLPTPRLKCLNVTYGGLLVPQAMAEQDAVKTHLREVLAARDVDHIMISKMATHHPLFASFQHMRGVVIRERRPHWCADLVPGSYEETVEQFERKDRYNRRKVRTMEKKLGELDLFVATREEHIDEFIAGAVEVANRSFQAALGAGFEDSPLWRAILTSAAREGLLRCYLLRCNGAPLAFQVGTVSGSAYVLDAAAYDPEHRQLSPGTVLLILVIRDLCENDFTCLDYGFGDAPYKQQYGTRHWEECNIHLYSNRPQAQLARAVDQFGVISSRTAKRLAGSGAIQRIRRTWRRRLEQSV